jgi:hypothetical protein
MRLTKKRKLELKKLREEAKEKEEINKYKNEIDKYFDNWELEIAFNGEIFITINNITGAIIKQNNDIVGFIKIVDDKIEIIKLENRIIITEKPNITEPEYKLRFSADGLFTNYFSEGFSRKN